MVCGVARALLVLSLVRFRLTSGVGLTWLFGWWCYLFVLVLVFLVDLRFVCLMTWWVVCCRLFVAWVVVRLLASYVGCGVCIWMWATLVCWFGLLFGLASVNSVVHVISSYRFYILFWFHLMVVCYLLCSCFRLCWVF